MNRELICVSIYSFRLLAHECLLGLPMENYFVFFDTLTYKNLLFIPRINPVFFSDLFLFSCQLSFIENLYNFPYLGFLIALNYFIVSHQNFIMHLFTAISFIKADIDILIYSYRLFFVNSKNYFCSHYL